MDKKNTISIKTIVAIGIGAALFFVLGRFVAIPSPVPNTTINIQYGVLSVFSIIYGPFVGALAGFIGHTLIDLTWGSPWWSWILASAVFGLIVGLARKAVKVEEGRFGGKEILIFNAFQVVAHIFAWAAVAPTLDIIIYNEPIEKIYLQGAFAAVSNAVSTAIIGTLLLIAYAKTRTRAGSLKKED